GAACPGGRGRADRSRGRRHRRHGRAGGDRRRRAGARRERLPAHPQRGGAAARGLPRLPWAHGPHAGHRRGHRRLGARRAAALRGRGAGRPAPAAPLRGLDAAARGRGPRQGRVVVRPTRPGVGAARPVHPGRPQPDLRAGRGRGDAALALPGPDGDRQRCLERRLRRHRLRAGRAVRAGRALQRLAQHGGLRRHRRVPAARPAPGAAAPTFATGRL
ncbi:MAG: hypothetical protein AVDCRST_MAG16-3113, partial [uncultured Frankineae bacterium]